MSKAKSWCAPVTKHDKQVLADAIQRQKKGRLEKASMVSAIQDMMQGFGIPSVEFADEDGTVHGRIDAPKPEDVPCEVPAYGGGTVSIKQGDHIRLWYKDNETGEWIIEGQATGRLNQGIVLCIRPDRHVEGLWKLAFQRDNSGKDEGQSFCCIRRSLGGFERAVEKIL
jgi:hypothetical protein